MAEAAEEVDFTKLPIDERCQHKNWKARVSGYEDLTKLFQQQDDEKSPEFHKYAWILRKFPVDSNAAAQEKGLTAVNAFVELASPAVSSKVASEIISGVIAKCLISPKVKTKELAHDIILMFIEVEKHELVLEELLKGVDNKTPKIVVTCINLLKLALCSFGPKIIKPSPLIKYITSKGLEDRDKTVRDESKQLAIEIYRWMKDAFKSQLSGLKPVTLSELETEFEKVATDRPSPSRYLRSEQERVHVQRTDVEDEAVGAGVAAHPEAGEEIDPYDLLEPVDILSKLPSDFYTNCESKKWQERKAALDCLQELLTPNPKIAAGDYADIVKTLKKFIQKDTMIPVVAASAKCLCDLAIRLKKSFSPYAHSCISICLEKFKEKKVNVVAALREAIDACMLSYSLENILEDISTALDNKNPQIKTETASFLTRQFASQTFAILSNKKLLKQLIDPLIKTLSDMDATVRDASAEAIGTAMKVVGEKLISPLLADVDPIKMAKINEFYEKAVVKYPAPAGGHPAPRSVTAPAVTRSAASAKTEPPAAAEKAKPKAKPVTLIVNKPLSTKGIKSKTDCGRPKTAAPAAGGSGGRSIAGRIAASSTDDLSDTEAYEAQAAVTKKPTPLKHAKSIIPPKSSAPKIGAARSKTDCGLRKNASAPALDKPVPAPSAGTLKSRIGMGLKRPNGSAASASNLPSQPYMRSQSPLDEKRSEEVDDDYSDEEPVIQHSAVRSRIMAATPLRSATKMMQQEFGSGNEPSPIATAGYYSSPRSATDTGINYMLADMRWNEADPAVALYAIQKLHQLLKTNQAASLITDFIVDEIISACTKKYQFCRSLFDDPQSRGVSIELYNSISELLGTLFKQDVLRKRASVEALKDLMPAVIAIIIDPRMEDSTEGKQIARTVNILATGIVQSADQTNMLCALLKQLHLLSGNRNTDAKFTEMVMKCIWKQARGLSKIVDDMNIDLVLVELHNFLRDFPKDFWTEKKDVPFRTVRTVTYMIVQSKGEDIFDHLSLIPDAEETEIFRYITRILKDLPKASTTATTSMRTPQRQQNASSDSQFLENGNRSTGVKNYSTLSQHAAACSIDEHNLTKEESHELSAIFKLIASNELDTGFSELLAFTESHPHFNLESHLSQTSTEFFKSYVLKSLDELRTQRQLKENGNKSCTSAASPPVIPVTPLSSIKKREIPRLTAASEINKADVMNWMDAVSRLIDAPDLKKNVSNLERKVATFGSNEQENLMTARQMAMEARLSVEELKKKYSINI